MVKGDGYVSVLGGSLNTATEVQSTISIEYRDKATGSMSSISGRMKRMVWRHQY